MTPFTLSLHSKRTCVTASGPPALPAVQTRMQAVGRQCRTVSPDSGLSDWAAAGKSYLKLETGTQKYIFNFLIGAGRAGLNFGFLPCRRSAGESRVVMVS